MSLELLKTKKNYYFHMTSFRWHPYGGRFIRSLRQQQGYTHSGQGGGHGSHGPPGLQQQGTGSPTRHKHLPSPTQGPHPPTQKQAHLPPQKHTPNRRLQHSKIQTIIPNQCHPTQILWPPQNPQNRHPSQTYSIQ